MASATKLGIVGGIVVAVVSGVILQFTDTLMPKTASGQRIAEPSAPVQPTTSQKPVVMGALERGVNRQGRDLDAYGKHTDNAELCAELCRTTPECDSMTYVISRQTCWMKSGIPDPSSHSDMISAVKQR